MERNERKEEGRAEGRGEGGRASLGPWANPPSCRYVGPKIIDYWIRLSDGRGLYDGDSAQVARGEVEGELVGD